MLVDGERVIIITEKMITDFIAIVCFGSLLIAVVLILGWAGSKIFAKANQKKQAAIDAANRERKEAEWQIKKAEIVKKGVDKAMDILNRRPYRNG